MLPYWFINSKKIYIILIKDVKNRRDCGWKCGDVRNALHPAQLFSGPKTAPKNSLLIFFSMVMLPDGCNIISATQVASHMVRRSVERASHGYQSITSLITFFSWPPPREIFGAIWDFAYLNSACSPVPLLSEKLTWLEISWNVKHLTECKSQTMHTFSNMDDTNIY